MKVAVLCGGRSSEHEVSLASGTSVRAGLAEGGHEVLDVRIGQDGVWRCDGEEIALVPGRGLLGADVAFPALHGPFGEDGTVQGLLECLEVAYVGAGVLASALSMDKILFKELMGRAGVPQVEHAAVRHVDWRARPEAVLADLAGLELPVFVKPSRLGSSVGIARVLGPDELAPALDAAFAHDDRVLVEAMAPGIEVECSVMGPADAPVASEPGEIVLAAGEGSWYDYEAKYSPGGMELVVPARVGADVRERIRRLAVETFLRVGCSGLARVDFFVDGERVLVNELNTIPGFTATSVFAKLFEAAGVPYVEVLDRLCGFARERLEAQRALSF